MKKIKKQPKIVKENPNLPVPANSLEKYLVEISNYKKIDPIDYVQNILLKKKYASPKDIEKIQADVKSLVRECVDFADSSPFPDPKDLYTDIYDGSYNFITH